MAEADPYRIWEVLGTWVSGVGTAAAVVPSLWLARRQFEPRMRVSASKWLLISGVPTGTASINPADFPTVIIVEGTNIGVVPIRVTGVWWGVRIPRPLRWLGLGVRGTLRQNPPAVHLRSRNLLEVMQPTETLQWTLEYELIVTNLVQYFLAPSWFWRLRLHYLSIAMSTSVGQTMFGQVNSPMKQVLKARVQEARRTRHEIAKEPAV
jgi:hypothetical protein